ncbi:hypothetical protein AVEN_163714-1 [Araneus ventricosus]|uniref:Mos1 transposase HTH domain-containing protein n=1 Tax=Araneus ventricosus TaxID=182803 RepID=A0A4Y2I0H1_ARAVE|nr:hypothetical protein AVEN_163714-1 [Araneus ventricosus]
MLIMQFYNCFKDGCISIESEAYSGRSSTPRNEIVIHHMRALVMQDRRIAVRELADVLPRGSESPSRRCETQTAGPVGSVQSTARNNVPANSSHFT